MTLNPVPRKHEPHLNSHDSVRIAGSRICQRAHICAFFSSAEDEYNALLPFIKEGLESSELAVHVVNPQRCKDHTERLSAAGVDVAALQQTGQFELHDWKTAYVPDGKFDMERTMDLWQRIIRDAHQRGFPATRFVAHMEWALEPGISLVELLRYEAKVNIAWTHNAGRANPVVCTYDVTKFRAEVIIEVLRTHPAVVLGGVLHENPFYVPPEEYLQELKARRLDSTGIAA